MRWQPGGAPRISLLKILRGVLLDPGVLLRVILGKPASSIDFEDVVQGLPRDPVIIEAGAGDGSDSLKIIEKFPAAQLHSFEPHPALFAQLEKKVGSKAQIYRLALGKEGDETVEFWLTAEHESSSILRPTRHAKIFPDIRFEKKPTIVKAVSLDSFMESQSLTKVDLLWLDLQGAELMVLENGGTRLLSICEKVHLEVANQALYEGAPLVDQTIEFMKSQGFELKILRAPFVFGNALFQRKRF